jgi:hypothetical protein
MLLRDGAANGFGSALDIGRLDPFHFTGYDCSLLAIHFDRERRAATRTYKTCTLRCKFKILRITISPPDND